MGGREVEVIDKSQAVVGGTLGEGVEGRRRHNKETGLSGGASCVLGMARWASPADCSSSCTDCAKVSTGKAGAKEMHPLETSIALKRTSAHIQMADRAGVPGVRMVVDGAWVRMDIATNKEQCQDKETPKGGPVNKKRSRPVVTGQQAAQRKNSPRQWGRPFGRAPWEICPAISTHPHWGGDCTTTLRWQDVGAEILHVVFKIISLDSNAFFQPPLPRLYALLEGFLLDRSDLSRHGCFNGF